MKKITCLLAPVIIMFSCKKTDPVVNTLPQQTYIVPSKIIVTDANGTNTATFSYNGNKLKELVSTAGKAAYTYTGNLLTKITTTNAAPSSDLGTEDYFYNTDTTLNSVITYTEYTIGGQLFKDKSILRFTYNSNGTVSQRNYNIDIASGVETADNYSILNTFTNGNVIKKNNIHYADFNTSVQTLEYDTKNSPYKNVLSYNRIFNEHSLANNLLKQTTVHTIYFNGQTITTSDVLTRAYVYNNDNFPTEIKYFSSTGVLSSTTQFIY
jgi:hypothetical protein